MWQSEWATEWMWTNVWTTKGEKYYECNANFQCVCVHDCGSVKA